MMTGIHIHERRGGRYLRRNRSDGRLKRYSSCADGKAWSQDRCERHNYLMDYIASSYDSPPNNDSHWGEYVPVPVLLDVIVEPYKSEIQMLQSKINNLQNELHQYEEGMSELKKKEEDIVSEEGITQKSMASNFLEEGTKEQEIHLKEQEIDFEVKESSFEDQEKGINEQERDAKGNYIQEKENFDETTSSDQIKKIRSNLKEINSDFDALMFSNENEINSLKYVLKPPVSQTQQVYATTIEATPNLKSNFREKDYSENLKNYQEDVERKATEVQDLLENLKSQLLEENSKNEMISRRISRKPQAKRMKWQNKIQETEKGMAWRDKSIDTQEYSSLKDKIDILSKRVSSIEKIREKMDQERYKEARERDNWEYLSKIKDLEDKMKKLEEEMEKKKNKTNELMTQLKIYSEKLDQVTGSFDSQEENLSQLKEQLKCCEIEKKEIEEQVKQLESQIMFAKENKDKSGAEMRESETQTLDDELKKQIESLLSELERAETQLAHKTNTIDSINEIILLTETRLHDRETELSEIEDRYQKLLEEYLELQLKQQIYEENLGSEKPEEKTFLSSHEIVVEPIKEGKESEDMEEIFTVSEEEQRAKSTETVLDASEAEKQLLDSEDVKALEEGPERKEVSETVEDSEVEKNGIETEVKKGEVSIEEPGEVTGTTKDEVKPWDGKEEVAVEEPAEITEVKQEEIDSGAGKSTFAIEEPETITEVKSEEIESVNNKSEVSVEKPEAVTEIEKELVEPETDETIEEATVTAETQEGEVNSKTGEREHIVEDPKIITETEPEVIDPMTRKGEASAEDSVMQIEKEDEPIADKDEIVEIMVKDLENEDIEPVTGKNEVPMEEPKEEKEDEAVKSDDHKEETEAVTMTEQEEIESETVINKHRKKEAEETEEKEQEQVESDIGKNEVLTEKPEPATEVEEAKPEAGKSETSIDELEMISEAINEETKPELEKLEVPIDEPEKIIKIEEEDKPEAEKSETLLEKPETRAKEEQEEVETNVKNDEIAVEIPDTIKGEGQNIESENEKSEIPAENPENVAETITERRQDEIQAEAQISEIPVKTSKGTTETVGEMAEDVVKQGESYISGSVSNIPNGDKEEMQVEEEKTENTGSEAKESELEVEKREVDIVDPEKGEASTKELEMSGSPEAVSDIDDLRQKELNAEKKNVEALVEEPEKLDITEKVTDGVDIEQNKTESEQSRLPEITKEVNVEPKEQYSAISPKEDEHKNKQSVCTEPRVSITPKKVSKTKETTFKKPVSSKKSEEPTLNICKNVVKPKETKVRRESKGCDSLNKAKLSITQPNLSQRSRESQTTIKEKPDDVGKVSAEGKSKDRKSLHQENKQKDEKKALDTESRKTDETLRLSSRTCKEDKDVQTIDIPETSQKPHSIEAFDLLKMENEQLKERVANLENEKASNLMTIDSLQRKIDELKVQQFAASEPPDMKDSETETDPHLFEVEDIWIQKEIDEIADKINKTQEILGCYKLIDQEEKDREVKLLEEVKSLKNLIKELSEKKTNIPQLKMPESEILREPTTEFKDIGKKSIVTDIVYSKKLQKHNEMVRRLQEHYQKSCGSKDVSSQRKSSSLRTCDSQPLTSKSTKTQQSLVETKKCKLQKYCSINYILYKYNGDQNMPRKEVGTCKEYNKIDVKYKAKDKTKIMLTMF